MSGVAGEYPPYIRQQEPIERKAKRTLRQLAVGGPDHAQLWGQLGNIKTSVAYIAPGYSPSCLTSIQVIEARNPVDRWVMDPAPGSAPKTGLANRRGHPGPHWADASPSEPARGGQIRNARPQLNNIRDKRSADS